MSTGSPISLDYALVDVFAERPLEGNMLAIFSDARGLSTERMQALARETNLAETTFILPAEQESAERASGIRVRIFTTQEELPFAGHPTLGTASWLYLHHPQWRGAEQITLSLNSGPVTVRFTPPAAGESGVHGSMRQFDPIFGSLHDPVEIARVLGLPQDALDPALPIQTVSTGLPFCIVPLRSLAAIQQLTIPQGPAQAYLAARDAHFFFCMAPADPPSGAHFHNRMQFYNGEDPATGSASGCAIAYLVQHGVRASNQPTVFEQGIEIGRPSRILTQATLNNGNVTDVFVAGRTIPVATGRFFLP